MTDETGGWTIDPQEDEAGIPFTYASGPEWGTRYADDGTQQELERLQAENTALKALVKAQSEDLDGILETAMQFAVELRDAVNKVKSLERRQR